MKKDSPLRKATDAIDVLKKELEQKEIALLVEASKKVEEEYEIGEIIELLCGSSSADFNPHDTIKAMMLRLISTATTISRLYEIQDAVGNNLISDYHLWETLENVELIIAKQNITKDTIQELCYEYEATKNTKVRDILFPKMKTLVVDFSTARALVACCSQEHQDEAVATAIPFILSLSDLRVINYHTHYKNDTLRADLKPKEQELVKSIKKDIKDFSEAIICSELAISSEAKAELLSLASNFVDNYFDTYQVLKIMPDSKHQEKVLKKLIPMSGSINQIGYIRKNYSKLLDKFRLNDLLARCGAKIQKK